MALDVQAQIEISRSARDVAAYAFEPLNDPVWIGGISNVELLTGRPIGKSTRVRRLAKFMGKTIDYILEVTEFVPDHLMVMKSIKSPFPMIVTYKFDSISEDKSLATVRVQGTAKGFYSIADFLMAPMVRKNIRGDVKRLKQQLEQ